MFYETLKIYKVFECFLMHIKYDKKHEERNREQFNKEQQRYSDKRGVWPLNEALQADLSDSGTFRDTLVGQIDTKLILAKLTKRQREVIELRINELHYWEIGDELNISSRTVQRHIEEARKKLGNLMKS